jgi:hypothetical protein
LVTLLTAYALRSRAGFISHRQRSWDSPCGAFSSRKASGVLPTDEPTYRFRLPVCSLHKAVSRSDKAAVPGMTTFRESLAERRGFNPPTAGCSLGFSCTDLSPER